MPRDPFSLVGTTIAEKYRVDRVIGEGGCGIVYAGVHLVVGAPVAIKCLKPIGGSLDDERRVTELFLREAKVLFSLTHPGIVRLYDVGALNNAMLAVPWVVLEYIDGPTLDAELSRRAHGRLPLGAQELLAIFEPVLEAVAFAHEAGIAHRDLKPSNVMLVRTPSGGVSAKVVDFGIARRIGDRRQTGAGVTGFTPRYAAPEQWDSTYGPTDAASDVFSLGLMIAEACTLRPALGAVGIVGILSAVTDESKRAVFIDNRPDLGPEIDAVVARATRLRREERYGNARELLAALRLALTTGQTPVSFAPTQVSPAPAASISHRAASHGDHPAAAPLPSNPPPPATAATAATAAGASYPAPATSPSAAGAAYAAPPAMTAPPAHAASQRSSAPLVIAIVAALLAAVGLGVALVAMRGGGSEGSARASANGATTAAPAKHASADDVATASKGGDGDDDDDDSIVAPTDDKKQGKKKKKQPSKAPAAPKADGPSIDVTRVMGGDFNYSEAQVYDVAEKNAPDLQECYRKALARDASLSGELTLMLTIQADGTVMDAMCAQDGIADGPMRACASARSSAWRFPKPKDDLTSVMLTYSFTP